MEIDVDVKSECKGNCVVIYTARVKISFDEEITKEIVQEVLEITPEFVDVKEIEKEIPEDILQMFEKEFEKELMKELKVDYEIKSIKKENEVYEIEVEEEFDPDWWSEDRIKSNIEKIKEIFEEDLEAIIKTAFANVTEKIARKIAEKLCKEESEEEPEEELKEEPSEEPVEVFRRAIVVASKDFYITLPKSYLKFLYRKYGKVPKWVLFKYYSDGRIVIEPCFEKEIPKEKLEWFGITKL